MATPIAIEPKCRRCHLAMTLHARPAAAPRRFTARCPRCQRRVRLTLGVHVLHAGRPPVELPE